MPDLSQLVKEYSQHAISVRETLHKNPELSGAEFETTELIKKELESYGVEIEDFNMKTGIVGLIRGSQPGPTVAIRADIDALPVKEVADIPYRSQNEGISHVCGHDIHTAVALLVGRVSQELKDNIKGNVRLIFQPAEEKGTGAMDMISAGIMELEPKTDLILGVHCSPEFDAGTIGLKKGPANASSDNVNIKVNGLGGHAAHPYKAVDPVIVSAYMLTQLQTLLSRENPAVKPAVLTFGTIHGGTRFNVIPSEVQLEGTLRAFYEDSRKNLWEGIRRVSTSVCEGMRATAEVEIIEGIPSLSNTPEIIDKLSKAASDTIGSENIVWIEYPSPGSDDFACYLEFCSGAQFRIGTGNEDKGSRLGLHNAGNIFDSNAIPTGASVILQYILNLDK